MAFWSKKKSPDPAEASRALRDAALSRTAAELGLGPNANDERLRNSETSMTSSTPFRLTPRSRFRAGSIAFIFLFLGGLALWAQFTDGLPRDWEAGLLVLVGSILLAAGMRFGYVAWTGRATELMADILHDIGRIHWHG